MKLLALTLLFCILLPNDCAVLQRKAAWAPMETEEQEQVRLKRATPFCVDPEGRPLGSGGEGGKGGGGDKDDDEDDDMGSMMDAMMGGAGGLGDMLAAGGIPVESVVNVKLPPKMMPMDMQMMPMDMQMMPMDMKMMPAGMGGMMMPSDMGMSMAMKGMTPAMAMNMMSMTSKKVKTTKGAPKTTTAAPMSMEMEMGTEMGMEMGTEMGTEMGMEMGTEMGTEMGMEMGTEMGMGDGDMGMGMGDGDMGMGMGMGMGDGDMGMGMGMGMVDGDMGMGMGMVDGDMGMGMVDGDMGMGDMGMGDMGMGDMGMGDMGMGDMGMGDMVVQPMARVVENAPALRLGNFDMVPVAPLDNFEPVMECPPEVATSSRDGAVKLWDTRVLSDGPVAVFTPEDSAAKRDSWVVCFGDAHSPSDRCLLAGFDNGDVKLFDLRTQSVRFEAAEPNGIVGAEFDRPDIQANKFVTTTLEGCVTVYDARTLHPKHGYAIVKKKIAESATVWQARHSPFDRDVFAACAGDGSVSLWKYEYPDQRVKKDEDDGMECGVAGDIRKLQSVKISTQPVNAFRWNRDLRGLAVCASFDQALRVLIVTKLSTV
ncbi:unnamed protein product [Notodromas monacha]|uniref:Uncharacterized protein n=1 Tax=Notodromas monacha TaxID=399045 RepID=A0A7R9BDS7_9CRUS|nr:unnamed protein product [Notodromas monacha]CAG0913542.1 unnamed protein product [Notodromas monacha]